MLGGAWFGSNKPNFCTIMQPLAAKLNVLTENGKMFDTPNGPKLVKVFPLAFTADNPAKDALLNKIGFNGNRGCDNCDQEGLKKK